MEGEEIFPPSFASRGVLLGFLQSGDVLWQSGIAGQPKPKFTDLMNKTVRFGDGVLQRDEASRWAQMFRLSFGMFFDVLARYCLAVDFCSDSCAPQPGDFEGVAPRNSDRPFAGILETDRLAAGPRPAAERRPRRAGRFSSSVRDVEDYRASDSPTHVGRQINGAVRKNCHQIASAGCINRADARIEEPRTFANSRDSKRKMSGKRDLNPSRGKS